MPHPSSLFVLAAALLLLPACGGDPVPEPLPGTPSDAAEPAVEVHVATDRTSYEPDDTVRLTLTARNAGEAPVTLRFASSQRYDFRVEEADGSAVWTWSAARSFLQVLGQETLEPGAERSWSETVDVRLEPGAYRAVGMVTTRDGPLVDRADFFVR